MFKRKKKINYKQEILEELKKIESHFEYIEKTFYSILEMSTEKTKFKEENKLLKKQIKEMTK